MALTQGVPSFMQVLEVVTTEMQVEAGNEFQWYFPGAAAAAQDG
jgi:hypothetical protein